MKRPSVLVVTRRTIRKHKYIDYVGESHLALLIRLGILPVMVPVVEGAPAFLPDYMANMQGLLLVEGEDIEPEHYPAKPGNFEYLEKTHPLKDQDRDQADASRAAQEAADSWDLPRLATAQRRLRRHAVRRCAKGEKVATQAH